MNTNCPVWSIAGDREVSATRVVTGMSLVRWQRGSVTGCMGEKAGSLGGWAGILHERVPVVWHGRTVLERAAPLHE